MSVWRWVKCITLTKLFHSLSHLYADPFHSFGSFLLITPDRPLTQHFCDSVLFVYNNLAVSTHSIICIIMTHVILSPNILIVSLTLSQLLPPFSYFSPPTIGIFCSAPERIPTSVNLRCEWKRNVKTDLKLKLGVLSGLNRPVVPVSSWIFEACK
jgi:hypothetical protein